jgi:hypothetical protein
MRFEEPSIMQKRNKNNAKKKRTVRQAQPVAEIGNDNLLKIPKTVGFIMPDRMRTNLRYWKAVQISLNVTLVGGARWSPSAAFDIDPLIGGTVMSGFTELAAIYKSYRVRNSTITAEFSNPSAVTPVMCTVVPTNADPGASPSTTVVLTAREQPYAKSRTSALAGGPTTRIVSSMSTKKIYGSPMTDYDDNFASLVTTVPNNNWFWFVSVYALTLIPSNPITVNVLIEIELDFYDRGFLAQ